MKRVVLIVLLCGLAGAETWEKKNFSGGVPPAVQSGDTFLLCNFSQPDPHTPICEVLDSLTFERCNLSNCDLPKDATVKDCLHAHEARTLVYKLSKEDVELQRKAEADAVVAAEEAAKKAVIAVPVGAKVEEMEAAIKAKIDAEVAAAVAVALAGKPAIKGLKEIDNGDGTLSFYRVSWAAVVPKEVPK